MLMSLQFILDASGGGLALDDAVLTLCGSLIQICYLVH